VSENNQGKCILIYEDDLEILLLCKTILLKSQYRVETLSRCENVIADIDRIKPNLILMDLWIPEIGGEKAIAMIKENPATRHIPVLLFSANTEIKEICKKINADGYIEKPFDIQKLKQTIEQNIY
jgi:CheY-like chemotaxis protein